MCLAPRQAFLNRTSYCSDYSARFTPFGDLVDDYGGEYKRVLKFQRSAYTEKEVFVPCRKCVECVQVYSNNWAVRCMLEAKSHSENCFITLTYDEQHVPESVSVREMQLFLKRLRKALGKKKIRYFCCGEYGEKSGRPHYHLILFGVSFSADRQYLKQDRRGNVIFTSPTLSRLWKNGFHSIGDLTFDSAKYCAKYMQKFNVNEKRKSFTIQSRKPAIGYQYAIDNVESISKTGKVYVCGKEYSAPWQFKHWYFQRLDTAMYAQSMGELKIIPKQSFDFVLSRALERRKKVLESFGFWNIRTKFKKELKKIKCIKQEKEKDNLCQPCQLVMNLMRKLE